MQVIPNGLGTILGKGEAGHVVGRLIGRVTAVKRRNAIFCAIVAFAISSILAVSPPAAAAASTTVSNPNPITIDQSLAMFVGVGAPFRVVATSDLNITPNGLAQYSTGTGLAQTITFSSTAPTDATVNGPTYTPAASASSGLPVTLTIDGSSTSVCSIDSTGVVSFNSVGTCTIDANQAGDANYAAAPQAQQQVTVGQGSQTITFSSTAPTDATVNGPTYTPAASASSGLPVTLTIDGSSTSVCSIDSTGVVSFNSVGTCTIDANQAGDANYAAAPQAQQQVTVLNAQTITFTSTQPTDATVNGPTYAATATASSSLTVTLTIDPASAGVCSIDNSGTVMFVSIGTCAIDANQAGDSDYAPAPEAQQTIAVGPGSQTISFTAPSNATVGATYTPTATASSGLPVTFSIDSSSAAGTCSLNGGIVSFTGVGSCVIDANQNGDADYLPAPQVQQTVTVNLNPQTITFTSDAPANATVSGPTYTPTATGGGSSEPVVFSIDSSSTAGCSVIAGVVSFTGAGTCVIDANQAGDGLVYAQAPQVQQMITVDRGAQTITFTSNVPGSPTIDGPGFTPTATGGASGNPVVFSIDASSTPGACTITSGVVAFTGTGTCVIDANQAGDSNYTAAPQAQEPITIEALASSTTLTESATAVTATISGGGPTPTGSVVFSVNGNVVGTVPLSQGTATLGYPFTPGHTYTVTVQYSGDNVYTASGSSGSYTAPAATSTAPQPTATTSAPPPPPPPPPAAKPKQAPLKIAVKLTSSRPERHGWWTAPVTVSFTCTRAGKRVRKCRRPVRLDRSGADQVVAGHKINIDLGKPSLRIVGLNAGATYLASIPAPGCQGRDGISGIRSCRISEKVIGRAPGAETVRFTAKAVNGAGTASSSSVTVSEQQLGLVGLVSSATGIYAVNTGRTYTLQVASKTKPLYVDGAVAPQLPVGGAHDWFVLNGHSDGTPLWELSVLLPSGLPQNAYWNVGVRIGDTIRIIAIRA